MMMKPDDYHLQLGQAAAIMANHKGYARYPLVCLNQWVRPAILLQQIHFFRDLGENLTGYMTWAFLTEDTEKRWIHDPKVLFHISEWNEGDRLWIMGWIAASGDSTNFIKQAYEALPSSFSEAKALRLNIDGSVRKISRFRRR